MPTCEETSETIVQIAARYAHHPDPNVRQMAMSLLTQYPGREERPRAKANALGKHGYYSGGRPPLNPLLHDVSFRRRPVDASKTIAGGGSILADDDNRPRTILD